ncbi:glycosyltransferase family 2 protein [Paraburkholderia sp. BCC1884]|uniref:glycosyltransferase family 2 protein n=1 Tax=Paraburkholderia sp. BCC1884 TaxID=2562668 RepID=UPI001182FBDA|nr:glycosyltransferase family 2 protein [Paraburkholderia sp. BCC1884]
MARIEISVVVPSYGCIGCLEELCARLDKVLREIVSSHEIVIVDDRSPDNSWPLVQSLSQRYPEVRGVRLSRNFGQQLAITAGLQAACGDSVVVMDCDLQDPPERIPDLLAEYKKGYDMVLARRIERSHSAFRRAAASAYFGLVSRMTGTAIDGSYGTFSILSRKVVNEFLRFSERDRHYLFILKWLGFNSGSIEYVHDERHSGVSSYSLGRLLKHAFSGVLFHNAVLLNWIMYTGLLLTCTSFLTGGFLIYRHLTSTSLPGWTSLAVTILLSTGVILASVGTVGLYISRLFEMAKGRPIYVVDTECGCEATMSKVTRS